MSSNGRRATSKSRLDGKGDATFESVGPDQSGLTVSGDAKGLAASDLNGKEVVDFVVAINDDKPAFP